MNNQNENSINASAMANNASAMANNTNAMANNINNTNNANANNETAGNSNIICASAINATANNAATSDKAIAEKIREQYVEKKQTKLDLLRKLDRKATKSAEIFSYTFGAVGTLVFGGGMCLAMEVIGNLMPLGIVIGCVGMAMLSANYFIYKAIAKKSRKKYESDILTLSEEILGE